MNNVDLQNQITLDNLKEMEREEILNAHKARLSVVVKEFILPYLSPNDYVLDIGCRDGMLLSLIEPRLNKSNLYGIDCSSPALTSAIGKGYQCCTMDMHSLSLDRRFNFILMSHVLEHSKQLKKVILGINRTLLPGGYLFIEVPVEEPKPIPTKWGHYQFFRKIKDVTSLWSRYKVVKSVVDPNKNKWMRILLQKP